MEITKKNHKNRIVGTLHNIRISKNILFALFRIIGPLLLILGILYWFGSLHPDDWTENRMLWSIPSVSRYLILPMPFVWTWIGLDTNGKFGVQLILLGFILIFASKPPKTVERKYFLKSVYSVSKVIICLIVVWHWFDCILEDRTPMEMLEQTVHYAIVYGICYLIGRGGNWMYMRKKSSEHAVA